MHDLRVTRDEADAILEALYVSLARSKAHASEVEADPVLLENLIDAIETEVE